MARRTVRVLSPMRMPLRPAHATSVTLASSYTTKPYLHTNHHTPRFATHMDREDKLRDIINSAPRRLPSVTTKRLRTMMREDLRSLNCNQFEQPLSTLPKLS